MSDLLSGNPSPLIELRDERLAGSGVALWLKRDDLIHPLIPGNKWRKLVPNLNVALAQGHHTILTFGGAWSNHIRAVAAAGSLLGIKTIGIIRGEEHLPLNPVLDEARQRGMYLSYLDREAYRNKASDGCLDAIRERFGEFYLLPEGGTNTLAVRSCRHVPREVSIDFDVICCAVGTGGTLAGIAAGLEVGQRAIGFSALKGGHFLAEEVRELQRTAFGATVGRFEIETRYHFGGFAKRAPALDSFSRDFFERHAIALESSYVAKMMYGVFDMAYRGEFPRETRVIAVITG